MKEENVNWGNLSEKIDELEIEGVLDGEEGHNHIISSEEEFQELLKALHEE